MHKHITWTYHHMLFYALAHASICLLGISYELSYETISSHLSPPSCPITDGENKEGNIMTYTGGAVRGNLLSMGDIIIYTEEISRYPKCWGKGYVLRAGHNGPGMGGKQTYAGSIDLIDIIHV